MCRLEVLFNCEIVCEKPSQNRSRNALACFLFAARRGARFPQLRLPVGGCLLLPHQLFAAFVCAVLCASCMCIFQCAQSSQYVLLLFVLCVFVMVRVTFFSPPLCVCPGVFFASNRLSATENGGIKCHGFTDELFFLFAFFLVVRHRTTPPHSCMLAQRTRDFFGDQRFCILRIGCPLPLLALPFLFLNVC